MPTYLTWIILLAPLSLAAGGFWPAPSRGDASHAKAAAFAAALAFLFSAAAAAAVVIFGPLRSPLLGLGGVGLSLQVDALSGFMLLLVSFVGLVVVRYSGNYLNGDSGQIRFTRQLLLTIASVLMLILSGNAALLVAAWIGTSLLLNRLLLFYPDRPAAVRAARKKYVASRVGDACLITACIVLYAHLGTLEIADIASAAREGIVRSSFFLSLAGLLVVVTAMLKSAQLPLHGWLLEVMETPTPVSALLHAGIINAGGFLILRFADILQLALPALDVLAIVGGLTALFGSLVMLTQTSVKVQLAYSTIAQMGFMLLQCGLGAFSSALLHIVAHSLYKAHAFLSSGSVMDLARASWTPSPGGQPHPARLFIALCAVVGVTLLVGSLFGVTLQSDPARIAFGSILLMGLVHLLANSIDERPNAFVVARSAVSAAAVALLYFALQAAAERLTTGSLPRGHAMGGATQSAIAALAVLAFAAVTLFQNQQARRSGKPFFRAAYVHLRNGLYLNTLANRLVLAHWPEKNPLKSASSSRN